MSDPNPPPGSYHEPVSHSRDRLIVTRHLTIRGRVQGVWYRAWAVENARKLGLAGWVRNRRDGTVEAVVQGEPASVERFVELAREGSPGARVESIDARDWERVHSEEFEQHPTV